MKPAPLYPDLSIVIPLHNEETRLAPCLARLINYVEINHIQAEILLAPNGCTDGTVALAERYHESVRAWVRVIPIAQRGKGAAVRAGMLAARGKYIYMADVDLSTPAREIHKFMLEIERGFPVVIGSREISPETTHTTLQRRVIGRMFHLVTGLMVENIRDTQCGFKMFKREAARVIFGASRINGMAFDVEALFLAQCSGFQISEIAVDWKHDPNSRVRMVIDSLSMLVEVLTLPLIHFKIFQKGGFYVTSKS